MFDFLPNEDCVALILDDIPSYYWRIGVADRPNVPTPERQAMTTSVLGRLGEYREYFSFNDMELTITLNYLEDVEDFKAFKAQFYSVRKWLLDGQRLSFSDEPDVYYIVKGVSVGDATNDVIEYGEFDVTFTLAPFARVYEDEPIRLATSATGDVPILVETIENSYPLIVFTATVTNPEFRINDFGVIRFTGLTVNTVYYFDCELQVFYRKESTGNVEMALNVQTIVYPEFTDGVNQFYSKGMKNIEIYRNAMR